MRAAQEKTSNEKAAAWLARARSATSAKRARATAKLLREEKCARHERRDVPQRGQDERGVDTPKQIDTGSAHCSGWRGLGGREKRFGVLLIERHIAERYKQRLSSERAAGA